MNKYKWVKKLETDRLILRELKKEDMDFVYNHFSNEDVCKYLLDNEPLKKRGEALEIINYYKDFEAKDHSRWGIVLKESNILLGTCGFHRLDRKNNIIEIGYDLNKSYWGQGYMTEALKEIIYVAFTNMQLNRIQAYVYIENIASYKLLEKLKFIREGVIRDKHLFRGNYYDHYCYSLLAKDWK
ncbi:MAG: GNAT family N-acetyltransferase [Firmicutes bacterium]|nr:GNAT family N-acetyltransferase [Bacillota bacterium]